MAKSPAMYFVYFTDKGNNGYDLSRPEEFLSQRALDRRARLNIAVDSADMPVSRCYIDSIESLGAEFFHASKWINGALIFAPESLKTVIEALDFVDSVEMVRPASQYTPKRKMKNQHPYKVIREMDNSQNEQIAVDRIHALGFKGQGVLVAVLDAGFPSVNTLAGFDSLRARNGILDTYDFVQGKVNVYDEHEHGTCVLSTMAYNVPDEFVGSSPEADFCLYRTEANNEEYLYESDLWVIAAERADSIGADVITSSLGYYFTDDELPQMVYENMNGEFFRSSIAARMASERGIIVLVAAGNEGESEWRYIDTPADADGILTVGGVDADGYHSYFSSYGPSADGRIKPEICARATSAVVADAWWGGVRYSNGTSFATPILAGMMASLVSALPNVAPDALRRAVCEHASQAENPDNTLGYGIPNAYDVYEALQKEDAVEEADEDEVAAFFREGNLIVPEDTEAFRLYDASGVMIFGAENGGVFAMPELPSGVYFLQSRGNTVKVVR